VASLEDHRLALRSDGHLRLIKELFRQLFNQFRWSFVDLGVNNFPALFWSIKVVVSIHAGELDVQVIRSKNEMKWLS